MRTAVKQQCHQDGVFQTEMLYIPQGDQQIIVVGLMAWLALPPMIRRLMENRASWVKIPASMAGIPHGRVQQSGDGTGNHPRDERAQQRHPDIDPIGHQHDAHRAACGHGAVYRQVGQIQDLKR